MSGRPKKKNGRVVNYYLSDEVLDLIEEYRDELSRSQFIEKAVKFYVSNLVEDPKEGRDNQKNQKGKTKAQTVPRAGIEPATFRSSV